MGLGPRVFRPAACLPSSADAGLKARGPSSPSAELDQLPAQMLWQISTALRFAQIRGRIFHIKIAPPLKRAPRLRHRAIEVAIEIKTAALAVIVRDIINGDDFLAHSHDALNHPIERPALQHVINALWPHPRTADRCYDFAFFFLGALDLADLPLSQILDAIRADAQFYDMNCHYAASALTLRRKASATRTPFQRSLLFGGQLPSGSPP